MPQLYFEDFSPGETMEFALEQPITREEIVAFAKIYDPQPFHLDEAAGRASLLGGLAASGWHACVIAMRANYDHWICRSASLGAPGIEEVRWLKPLRPGDILHFTCLARDRRLSRSRPGVGLIAMECRAKNQRGEDVYYQRHHHMMALRDGPAGANEPFKPRPPSPTSQTAPAFSPAISKPENFPELTGYFEDYPIGRVITIGATRFERDAIVDFARRYDPQPFHLSEEDAALSLFGKLSASGWQTACCWMGHMVRWSAHHREQMTAKGVKMTSSGPSPGFTDLAWRKPTFVGDVITFATEAIEKRKISRPGWGLVFAKNTGVNQNGEQVYENRTCYFAPTRGD